MAAARRAGEYVGWGDGKHGTAWLFAKLRYLELGEDNATVTRELAEHWAPQDVLAIMSEATDAV